VFGRVNIVTRSDSRFINLATWIGQ